MANRSVDDFLPRANLKKVFNCEEISRSDQISVKEFPIKFIVEETYVVAYLSHLELLDLKKTKCAEHRLEKKESHGSTSESPTHIEQNASSSSESSEEEELLAEIRGDSSESSSESVQVAVTTRRGRQCTTYRTQHFFGDSD